MTQANGSGSDLRIALLWHNPDSLNLGVGAISRAHAGILKSAADGIGRSLDIVWIGNGGASSGVRVRGWDLATSVVAGNALTSELDRVSYAFDIAEGDSFSDLYGLRRFARIAALGAVVRRRGIPVVASPQTIGPFRSSTARRLAARSLRQRSTIWVRDGESLGVVGTLAPGSNANLASDVAFRLGSQPAGIGSSRRLRIGLNVSGLLMNDRRQGQRIGEPYGSTIFALADRLDRYPGIEVHLVPHVLGPPGAVDNDQDAAELVGSRFPSMTVATGLATPEEAKGYIAELDGLIASRMHACIAALSSGVPVLPLSYSPKFRGLFGSLGYDATVDLTASAATEVIKAADAFLDERDGWKARADVANDLALRRIDRYAASVAELFDAA